jgi:hypothetical protein
MERYINWHKQSQKYQVQIWDKKERKIKSFGLWGSLELARIAKRKAMAQMEAN